MSKVNTANSISTFTGLPSRPQGLVRFPRKLLRELRVRQGFSQVRILEVCFEPLCEGGLLCSSPVRNLLDIIRVSVDCKLLVWKVDG